MGHLIVDIRRLANKDEGWPHLSFLFCLLVCNIKIDSVFYFAVVGEEFQNTSWINLFLEQSVSIRNLDPVLYEFKTVARSDYPLKANPQESPASDFVVGKPLPGVISKCYFYITLESKDGTVD